MFEPLLVLSETEMERLFFLGQLELLLLDKIWVPGEDLVWPLVLETLIFALLVNVVVAILVDVGSLVLGAHAEGVRHQARLNEVLIALLVYGWLLK